jgi:hypothetical protein
MSEITELIRGFCIGISGIGLLFILGWFIQQQLVKKPEIKNIRKELMEKNKEVVNDFKSIGKYIDFVITTIKKPKTEEYYRSIYEFRKELRKKAEKHEKLLETYDNFLKKVSETNEES